VTRRSASILAGAAFVALTAVVAARTVRNLDVAGDPHAQRYGMQDFRDNFYYPSVDLLDGGNPYDAARTRAAYPVDRPLPAYSPIALLVHVPFALLPYRAAEAAYFAASALLLLAVAALALRGSGVMASPVGVFGVAAAMVLSRPGHQTLFLGQCTVLVVLGTLLALVESRRRPWLAGAGLALACLKPSYGAPLAVLMLLRRDTRAAVRGLLLAAVSAALAAAGPVRAAGGLLPFIASVRDSMSIIATDASFDPSSSLIRVDVAGLVGRLVGRPAGVAGALAGLLLLAVAGEILRRLAAREANGPRPVSDGLACLAVLLCVYHQSYDALLLVLPAVALAASGRGATPLPTGPVGRTVMLALCAVPALNYLATHTLVGRVGPGRAAWLLIADANGAAILLLFLLWAAMAIRRGPARSSS
jgi:hypothetical protein